jgi:hypothetical protein
MTYDEFSCGEDVTITDCNGDEIKPHEEDIVLVKKDANKRLITENISPNLYLLLVFLLCWFAMSLFVIFYKIVF